MSALDSLLAAGITERQLGYWIRQGYLHPDHEGGQGHRREWPRRELAIALLMKRLTDAGLTAAGAAEVARNAENVRALFNLGTRDQVVVDLGGGLELTINPAGREAAA